MEPMTETQIQVTEITSPMSAFAQKPAANLRVPCEVYSRVVGYLRPVQNWNAGKQQEFKVRKLFNVEDLGA